MTPKEAKKIAELSKQIQDERDESNRVLQLLRQDLARERVDKRLAHMTTIPDRIVAEVSKNWEHGEQTSDDTVAARFERIIIINKIRGYDLESWQYAMVATNPQWLNETIIAVFVFRGKPEQQGKDKQNG